MPIIGGIWPSAAGIQSASPTAKYFPGPACYIGLYACESFNRSSGEAALQDIMLQHIGLQSQHTLRIRIKFYLSSAQYCVSCQHVQYHIYPDVGNVRWKSHIIQHSSDQPPRDSEDTIDIVVRTVCARSRDAIVTMATGCNKTLDMFHSYSSSRDDSELWPYRMETCSAAQ